MSLRSSHHLNKSRRYNFRKFLIPYRYDQNVISEIIGATLSPYRNSCLLRSLWYTALKKISSKRGIILICTVFLGTETLYHSERVHAFWNCYGIALYTSSNWTNTFTYTSLLWIGSVVPLYSSSRLSRSLWCKRGLCKVDKDFRSIQFPLGLIQETCESVSESLSDSWLSLHSYQIHTSNPI
jgi:hypothetical protein